MPQLASGSQVAGYRIDALVGRGGMGVVYRAFQIGLERVVALKVIAPELLDDEDIRARFLVEARAAASVDHPNVIPVHEAGEADGVAYIAMRFVSGSDLRSLVRRGGALDPIEAAGFVAQAGAALDAIHRAGFVHRDVKPANLLVDTGGHVYLTDFGLAKQVLTRSSATRTGHWVGTLDYVSPEQIRGGRIDARADVYALGGVLHFALTGRVPFERHGDEAKLWAQLSAPPPAPSELRPDLRAEFDVVVGRAMAKSAEDRYPSAGDLGRAACAVAAGTTPSEPERMVARGAAAPGAAPSEPGIAAEASTRTAHARLPAGAIAASHATNLIPPPRGRPRRRGRLASALAAVLVLAGATATLALQGDDPDGAAAGGPTPTASATASPAPTPSPTPTAVRARTIRGIGDRPTGITIAGGDVWVTSTRSEWITRVSTASGKERSQHPKVGRAATAMVAYQGSVWVATAEPRQLIKLDSRTGRKRATITLPSKPVRLAVADSGVWVAIQGVPGRTPQVLRRYDRASGELAQEIAVPEGISALVAAGGAIWLVKAAQRKLARLEPGSSTPVNWVTLPGSPMTMRYGAGALWITLRDDDTLVRVRTRDRNIAIARTGHDPMQAVVAGDHVYVASRGDQAVDVLDRRKLQPVGEPIEVGLNPYAMVADRRYVWVTGLGDNTLTRIDQR